MRKSFLVVFVLIATFLLRAGEVEATVTVLHNFNGTAGSAPWGDPVISGDTMFGMSTGGGGSGYGTIFSMGTDGSNFTLLHEFVGGGSDGRDPRYGTLVLSGSTLYGMTRTGGDSNFGVIFSMGTDGSNFTLLHEFAGASDGKNPMGGLTLSGGTLYGMTSLGGSSNKGTIFSMGTDGSNFTLLHEFVGGTDDGNNPQGNLTLSGGTLYGMTSLGGSSNKGTIFSMGTDGSNFTLLHEFVGGTDDGDEPYGYVTISDSMLYGMTYVGGDSDAGTIFSMGTDGSNFTLLREFVWPNVTDGSYPSGSFSLFGNTLYGVAEYGGTADQGVIFSINTDGSDFTIIHSFDAYPTGTGGSYPYNSVTISGTTIYGMTPYGGSSGNGVIYSLPIPDTTAPSISLAALTPDPTTDTTPDLTGTAVDILRTVANVEFQMDSTSGSWTNCVADDGTFDEASEAFTCTVVSALSDGSHSMYIRTTDDSANVTDSGSYSSDTFTVASPTPTPTSTPTSGPTATPAPEKKEQVAQITSSDGGGGGAVTAIQEGSTDTQQEATAVVETGTLKGFDAYLSSSAGLGSSVVSVATSLSSLITSSISSSPGGASGSTFKPPVSNAFVVGGDNGVLALKLPTGIAWGIGSPQQLFFKTLPPAGSDLSGAVIIPQLQQKPSIVALSYTNSDLIPPGDPTHPFNPKTLKLAHSLDGITWKILPTSVVDTQNKTVAALDKIYGWYMIVSPSQFGGRNTFTTASTLGATTNDETTMTTQDTDVELPKKVKKPIQQETTTPAKEQPQNTSIIQKIVNFVKGLF